MIRKGQTVVQSIRRRIETNVQPKTRVMFPFIPKNYGLHCHVHIDVDISKPHFFLFLFSYNIVLELKIISDKSYNLNHINERNLKLEIQF